MNTTQSALTMVGLNTNAPKVFWNGNMVEGITAINVTNTAATQRVVLTLPEDPVLAEMQAAGIVIKRSLT